MTRWAFLVALPYVVTVSTWSVMGPRGEMVKAEYQVGNITVQDKETAEDLAECLNMAHERRTKERCFEGNKSACDEINERAKESADHHAPRYDPLPNDGFYGQSIRELSK